MRVEVIDQFMNSYSCFKAHLHESGLTCIGYCLDFIKNESPQLKEPSYDCSKSTNVSVVQSSNIGSVAKLLCWRGNTKLNRENVVYWSRQCHVPFWKRFASTNRIFAQSSSCQDLCLPRKVLINLSGVFLAFCLQFEHAFPPSVQY